MGILSSIAKIAGVGLAPFTGGASLGLTALGGIGDVLGKQQSAAGQGAATTGQLTNNADRNAIDLYQAQQQAQQQAADEDLKRKAFTTSDRGNVMKQALLGSILQGGGGAAQFSMPGLNSGTVSNPLAGLSSDPQFLESLKNYRGQTSAAGAAPPSFTGGNILKAPALTPLPQESGTGKTLDLIARIAQLAGATAPLVKKPQPMDEQSQQGLL
jgi:hypothetical protein